MARRPSGKAADRPEWTFGLTAETSELLAKADFETSAVVGDGVDLRNGVSGSLSSGE
jgi:hypothetical protein